MTCDQKRCAAAACAADAAENFLLYRDKNIDEKLLIEELTKAVRAWRDSYEEDVGRPTDLNPPLEQP